MEYFNSTTKQSGHGWLLGRFLWITWGDGYHLTYFIETNEPQGRNVVEIFFFGLLVFCRRGHKIVVYMIVFNSGTMCPCKGSFQFCEDVCNYGGGLVLTEF